MAEKCEGGFSKNYCIDFDFELTRKLMKRRIYEMHGTKNINWSNVADRIGISSLTLRRVLTPGKEIKASSYIKTMKYVGFEVYKRESRLKII